MAKATESSAAEKVAELKVERMRLDQISPHPRNPRKHPTSGSKQWEVLRRSLDHDYFDPLVVNSRNGMLVSGHLRHRILLELEFTEADVSVVDYDEETHLARLIAANRLIGEFEEEILAELAAEIEASDLDSSLAGFTSEKLAALFEMPEVYDDSESAGEMLSQAEELQEKWKVEEGNLFEIGNHRLLCGDCTDLENVNRLLKGESVDMVWTDPPYNVNYDDLQEQRNELAEKRGKTPRSVAQAILNDDLPEEVYAELLSKAFSVAMSVTKPGGSIYVAHADHFGLLNRDALASAGWYITQCLIWVKSGFTLGRQDYQWKHEPILYGWKPGAGHYWQGGFAQSTVIDDEVDPSKLDKKQLIELVDQLRNDQDTTVVRAPRNSSAALHPTIKPLDLVARQIWNSSRRGDTVLELFGGSGTTLLAAEKIGRRCFGTELDPKYCAVIMERAEAAGLKVRKLESDDA